MTQKSKYSANRATYDSANRATYDNANRATYDSADGAEYESQGQARSEAERVAPGYQQHTALRPEGPKYPGYYALSGLEIF